MVADALFLIDARFLLEASQRAFHESPLLIHGNGKDGTIVYGFVRDFLRIRKQLGIQRGSLVIGKETLESSKSSVVEDLLLLLRQMGISILKENSCRVGDLCGRVTNARWIVTADQAMLQLVSDTRSVILFSDSGKMEIATQNSMVKMGVRPNQIPSFLTLTEANGKLILKKGQAIRFLQLNENLKSAIEDPALVNSRDWRRMLVRNQEALLNRVSDLTFSSVSNETVIFSEVNHPLIHENESAHAMKQWGFWSLIRMLPSPPQVSLEAESNISSALECKVVCQEADFKQLEEVLTTANVCAIDTEGSGKDPRIAALFGVAFSASERQAYYVPLLQADLVGISPDVVRRRLAMLVSKSIKFIGHNLKYDAVLLHQHGINLHSIHFDTMLAANACFGDWDFFNLSALARILLGKEIKRYKDIVKDGETFLDKPFQLLVEHACADANVALKLHRRLTEELKKKGIEEQFYREDMQLAWELTLRECNGVPIDMEKLSARRAALAKDLSFLENEILSVARTKFSVSSTKETTDALRQFGFYGGEVRTLSDTLLEQLACQHSLPRLIAKCRRTQKHINKIDMIAKAMKNGRLFPVFNQIRSSHGCLTSSNPNLDEAFAADAIPDKLISDSWPDWKRALRIILEITEDPILHNDWEARTCDDVFIGGDAPAQGLNHGELLLHLVIGETNTAICRHFLINKESAGNLCSFLVMKYHILFDWIDHFKHETLAQGFVTYKGRYRFLDGLKSSDMGKKNRAIKSAIRWLLKY